MTWPPPGSSRCTGHSGCCSGYRARAPGGSSHRSSFSASPCPASCPSRSPRSHWPRLLVDRSKNAWFLVGCYALGLAAQLSVGLRGLSNRPSNWYTSPWWVLRNYVTNFCMCVLFARTARGPNPLVARLAAEVVALRQPATHHPGLHRFFQGATWLWAGIFLLLTAGLAVMMVTAPAKMFLMLSTAAPSRLSSPEPARPHCGCAGSG